MKISIVIPNYNGMDFLPSCLDSLENVKYSYLDVIIVDNGSNDGSKEFIMDKIDKNHQYSYGSNDGVDKNHQRIYGSDEGMNNTQRSNVEYHLISNDSNLGFSKAVNQGIQLANTQSSDYICLLNNDVEVEPDFLANLIEVIEKDENIFSVASKMLQYGDKDLIDDAGDEYTLLGWTKRSGYAKSSNSYLNEREIFSSCAGAALYRKSVFAKIGCFDENFFAYMEDVDIGYRARINGFKNIYSPEAIVYHHGSGSSGSRYNEFKIKLASRNNIWIVYKNMPNLQILLNFGFLAIGFLIKYLFFLKMGYGKIYLEGLKEGIASRKKIRRVKFKSSNLKNYFKVEWQLLVNTFKLIFK